MSLDEQAELVQQKVYDLQRVLGKIDGLCSAVLTKHVVEGETFMLPTEAKQKLIQHYLTLKNQLRQLIDELP